MSKLRGVVKWFSPEKGFGFIALKGSEDVFVSYSSVLTDGFKTLKKGQTVEFEIEEDERGSQAKSVVVV